MSILGNRLNLAIATCALSVCLPALSANAVPIGGVEFPLGSASFADSVENVSLGAETEPPYNDPNQALGTPDGGGENALSLGDEGSVTLEFVNNKLVDQDSVEDGRDLFIFEVGPQVEPFELEISETGSSWTSLGTVSGQPTGVDIASFTAPGEEFGFVRITDFGAGMSDDPWAGADITAVGAIGSIATPVPTPGTLALFGFGFVALGGLLRGRKTA